MKKIILLFLGILGANIFNIFASPTVITMDNIETDEYWDRRDIKKEYDYFLKFLNMIKMKKNLIDYNNINEFLSYLPYLIKIIYRAPNFPGYHYMHSHFEDTIYGAYELNSFKHFFEKQQDGTLTITDENEIALRFHLQLGLLLFRTNYLNSRSASSRIAFLFFAKNYERFQDIEAYVIERIFGKEILEFQKDSNLNSQQIWKTKYDITTHNPDLNQKYSNRDKKILKILISILSEKASGLVWHKLNYFLKMIERTRIGLKKFFSYFFNNPAEFFLNYQTIAFNYDSLLEARYFESDEGRRTIIAFENKLELFRSFISLKLAKTLQQNCGFDHVIQSAMTPYIDYEDLSLDQFAKIDSEKILSALEFDFNSNQEMKVDLDIIFFENEEEIMFNDEQFARQNIEYEHIKEIQDIEYKHKKERQNIENIRKHNIDEMNARRRIYNEEYFEFFVLVLELKKEFDSFDSIIRKHFHLMQNEENEEEITRIRIKNEENLEFLELKLNMMKSIYVQNDEELNRMQIQNDEEITTMRIQNDEILMIENKDHTNSKITESEEELKADRIEIQNDEEITDSKTNKQTPFNFGFSISSKINQYPYLISVDSSRIKAVAGFKFSFVQILFGLEYGKKLQPIACFIFKKEIGYIIFSASQDLSFRIGLGIKLYSTVFANVNYNI